MSDLDMKRKDSRGEYVDTCSLCYEAYLRYEYDLMEAEATVEVPENNLQRGVDS
jgi:hypothetical protein